MEPGGGRATGSAEQRRPKAAGPEGALSSGVGAEPLLLEVAECARLSKSQYQQIAEDTVACCRRGFYVNEAGEEVALPLDEALETTRLHPASASLPQLPPAVAARGDVSVVRGSTLHVAQALIGQGLRTGVLNFASAKNPGGGFLRGANAQEEALARVTGLYHCLGKPEVQAFYSDNEKERSCVYTDHMIVSPAVPIFKAEDGRPLDAPYVVGVITAPAPNFGVASERPSAGGAMAIREARRRRMQRLLALFAAEGFDAVVLGAWGCGVFKNDPTEVAEEFRELLDGPFRGAIPRVVFAIVDEPTCEIFRGSWPGPGRGPALAPSAPARRGAVADGATSQRRNGSKPEGKGKSCRKQASWAKKHAADTDD